MAMASRWCHCGDGVWIGDWVAVVVSGPVFRIVQEDATRYLPHDPTGRCYEHFVYRDDLLDRNPFTGKMQPRLVLSGTRADCDAFVTRAKGGEA